MLIITKKENGHINIGVDCKITLLKIKKDDSILLKIDVPEGVLINGKPNVGIYNLELSGDNLLFITDKVKIIFTALTHDKSIVSLGIEAPMEIGVNHDKNESIYKINGSLKEL